MKDLTVNFKITGLEAELADPIFLESQEKANQGTLDYGRRHARAEFHVVSHEPSADDSGLPRNPSRFDRM